METSASYLGYNTYILGTTKNVLDCLRIVLYNKSEVAVDKISLHNINTVYNDVIKSEKYLRLVRPGTTDLFEYSASNGVIPGFDVIIYLDNSDLTPIGYTEFLNVQGVERNITISLSFETKVGENPDIILINSLSQLQGSSTKRDFIGEKLWEYTSAGKVKEGIETGYPRYTTHLSSLKYGSDVCNIFLDYGAIGKDMNLLKLDVSKGIDINPYRLDWSRYQLGYYGLDMVLYTWKDNIYSVYSITKRNKFGNPLSYTPSTVGYYSLPVFDKSKTQEIVNFSGKYIVVSVGSEYKLFDITTQRWVEFGDKSFVLDQWDYKDTITEIPKLLNYENVFSYLPDMSNVYLDLKKHSDRYSIAIVRKINSWYVLRQKITNSRGLLVYTNSSSVMYTNDSLTDLPMIFNDQLIVSKDTEINSGKLYYTIFTGGGEWYTEKARQTLDGGTLEYDPQLGIMFCNTGDTEKDEAQRKRYLSGEIKIVWEDDELYNSFFAGWRRNVLPKSSGIPRLIGSLSGLIFYIDENYLNYI